MVLNRKKNKEENEQQLQEKVNKIVYKMNLNFSSDDLHSRYWQAIYTYVKGVRNKIDTKHTLMKEVEVGGVGLNDILADKTVTMVDEEEAETAPQNSTSENINEPDTDNLPEPLPATLSKGFASASPLQ